MEKFFGTFKQIPGSVTGYQAYADARKIPKEVREAAGKYKESCLTIGQDGDSYFVKRTLATGEESNNTFKLNEMFSKVNSRGITVQGIATMEGDRMVIEEKGTGDTLTKLVRYFQGDQMIQELTCKDATMKVAFKRV